MKRLKNSKPDCISLHWIPTDAYVQNQTTINALLSTFHFTPTVFVPEKPITTVETLLSSMSVYVTFIFYLVVSVPPTSHMVLPFPTAPLIKIISVDLPPMMNLKELPNPKCVFAKCWCNFSRVPGISAPHFPTSPFLHAATDLMYEVPNLPGIFHWISPHICLEVLVSYPVNHSLNNFLLLVRVCVSILSLPTDMYKLKDNWMTTREIKKWTTSHESARRSRFHHINIFFLEGLFGAQKPKGTLDGV